MLAALLLLQTALPAPAWVRPPRPLPEGLGESSALVVSPARSGVLWTLNDSGNPAELFAVDTSGKLLGRIRVTGAANVDWEALASGPCPTNRPTGPHTACLYIGDIGDNSRERRSVTIYRVAEPDPSHDSTTPVLDSLRFVYPDSARDAESMVVARSGDLWIVSKERLRRPRLYRIPASAWRSRRIVVARAYGPLPIPSDSGVEQWTTDASWSADGRAMIIRTYGALWRLPFLGGEPQPRNVTALCSIVGLGPQGEGVAALGGGLYGLTSEKLMGSTASIALARCAE
ncbi:MAG TPA: hypothetical protein VF454_04385 [Gemmatimonadales bacterium]